jgi:hypothetical protein
MQSIVPFRPIKGELDEFSRIFHAVCKAHHGRNICMWEPGRRTVVLLPASVLCVLRFRVGYNTPIAIIGYFRTDSFPACLVPACPWSSGTFASFPNTCRFHSWYQ